MITQVTFHWNSTIKKFFVLSIFAIISVLISSGCAEKTEEITVGSADFSEGQLLATIYSHGLKRNGIPTKEKLNIGSREIYMKAIEDGSIDLLPEYSGTLLSFLNKDASPQNEDDTMIQLRDELPDAIIALQPSEAENVDTLTVRKDFAEENDLENISDLKGISKDLVLAGPAEWKSRYAGVPGLEDVYGIVFKKFKVFDAGGPLTLTALKNNQAQVGDMFSSDPAIENNDLVSLEDDKNLFGSARVVPIIRDDKATDNVVDTLNSISSKLTTQDLMDMNAK